MTDTSADRDPLDRLAEEFVARYRAGERPSLDEFAARLPGREDEVRDLFPALAEMEQLKPVTTDQTGGYVPAVEPSDPVRLGEFRILRRVGRGGMGVVYEAVQESLGRHVALKLLPAEALLDQKKLERFRREAKSAARLHHTNIVPVFGTGEADGRHFYAMQFIAGHPLDAVVEEVKRLNAKSGLAPLPPSAPAVSVVASALLTGSFAASEEAASSATVALPSASPSESSTSATSNVSQATSPSLSAGGSSFWATVTRVGVQVADALAYAHGQGVQHRDIKPANLLLDLQGTVWVADFGLAKSSDAEDLTHAGDVIGTLRYMAPERFDGSGDHRADIYALGLTLYELLTLRPAFDAANRAKLVEQVIAANPPRPRSINPAIPRDLETIVLKAIARDPAMRYQTAGELHDDLQRYLEDRPIRARRASSAEQAFRWCRRNPAVACLLAAVLLVFAAGAGVSWYFAVQAERKEKVARDEAALKDEEKRKVIEEQDRTRLLLYATRMNLAQVALNEGRIGRLIELLDEMRPGPGERDLRGWEWHYLWRLCYREAVVHDIPELSAGPGFQTDSIPRAILNAGGTHAGLIQSLEQIGPGEQAKNAVKVAVLDTATGKVLWQYLESVSDDQVDGGGRQRSDVLGLSDDGRFAAFGSLAGKGSRLRLFDTTVNREVELKDPGLDYHADLFVTPTADRIVACTRRPGGPPERDAKDRPLCIVWDRSASTRRQVPRKPLPGTTAVPLQAVALSADRLLVTLEQTPDGSPPPEVWDIGRGEQPTRRFKLPDGTVAFSVSSGGRVLLLGNSAGTRTLVSAETGRELGRLVPAERQHPRLWTDIKRLGVASDDGNTVVAHSPVEPGRIEVARRDTADPSLWHSFVVHHPDVHFAEPALSADGSRLTLASTESQKVRTWDTSKSIDHRATWNRPGPGQKPRARTHLGADYEYVASSDYGIVVIAHPASGFGEANLPGQPDRAVTVLDGRTGTVLHRLTPLGDRQGAVCVSPAGDRLLMTGDRADPDRPFHRVPLWRLLDTKTGAVIAQGEECRLARLHVFSPDGKFLILSGSADADPRKATKQCTVLDGKSGKPLCTVAADLVAAFDPTGKRIILVRAEQSNTGPGFAFALVCIDPYTGQEHWKWTLQHGVRPVAFSPDGSRFAVAQSIYNQTGKSVESSVTFLDAESGVEISSVAVSKNPLGPSWAGPGGGGLYAWGRESGISLMAYSPDGRTLGVACDRQLHVISPDASRPPLRLTGFDQNVNTFHFDASGRRIVTSEMERGGGTIQGPEVGLKVWDLESGRELVTLPLPDSAYGMHPGWGPRVRFAEGRLEILTRIGIRVFDGTPTAAKK